MNKDHSNPYIGPRTFQRDEGHLFYGRERESRDLLRLVVSEPLVLFYAQSGAGKSSIINTRLIPELESRSFEVLPIGRVSGDLPPGLEVENIYIYNLMHNLVQHETDPKVLAGLTLTKFLDGLLCDEEGYYYHETPQEIEVENGGEQGEEQEQERPRPSRRRMLIIDQFEELFSTHPEEWKKRDNFFRQLAQSMRDNPYLWVVLVMREDYIATLDPYAYLLPGGLRVRYYMQRLGREAALKAIKTPVESKRPYAPGVAEKLVDDLCSIKVSKPDGSIEMQLGQYVEPVQLQVICYNLWENLSEGTEITEKDLQEVGDVNTSLGNYYATRVKAVAEAKGVKERKIREWFSDKLIAPGGIRSMVMQESTPSAGGLDDDVIQALQSDLVRPEKRGGVTWYELTHDRLVEPILENNRDWFNEHLSPLQRQAALWRDQERNDSWLLVDQALTEVEEWAQEHPDEMTEIEEELLSACRKHQLRVNEIREMQQRELEMAQNLAKEQERLAEEQRKSAEQALQMAEEQQRFAKEQERYAQEQAQSAKRARLLTTIALTLFTLAIIAFGFAVDRSKSAQKSAATSAANEAIANSKKEEADIAKANADALYNSARARELASAAKSNLDSQPDLSILLSLEAYKAVENLEDLAPEVQSALFNSMQRALRLRRYLATSEEPADELRYSPNGKFIALLKKDGIRLWDISATDLHEPTASIPGTNAINRFASGDKFIFSPDPHSSQLIYLTHQGLNVWDVKNQKSLSTTPINDHTGAVQQILFLGSEGKTFAARGENGEVTLWDLEQSGAKQKSQSYHGDNVVLDPKGNKIAILDNQKGEITVLDLISSNHASQVNPQEPNTVTSLAFNQNGDVLAIGLEKGSVALWDLKDNSTRTINSQQTSEILSLVFDSSGKYIMYSTPFGAWRLDVENPPTPGNAGASLGYPIAASENGDKVVLRDIATGQLRLWDVVQNQQATTTIAAETLTLSPDGKYLAVYDKTNHVTSITDSSKPNDPPIQLQTDIAVSYMTFSKDGKLLAVGASDGKIQVWDIANTKLIHSDETQSGLVSSFVFSPDENLLIAGKSDGTFALLDITGTSEPIVSNTDFTGKITSFGFSEDKKFLYSVAQDGILLIDPSTLLPKGHVIPGYPLAGYPLRFITDANGKQILATRDRDNIILWDIQGDRPFGDTIQGYSAYLSQNKKFVVISQEITEENQKASTPDQPQKATNLVLLDVSKGRPFSTTPIRGENAYFSSNDQFVAISNSKDSTLTLWNTTTPDQVGELKGPFAQLQFVPGHDLLAMVKDGNVLFWSMSPLEQKGDPSKPVKGDFVMFSPDGEVFAATINSPTPVITLWNTATMEPIGQPIPGTIPYPSSFSGSYVSLFGIGEDQRTMVVQNNAGFTFWDIKTGNFLGGPIPQNNIYASPNYRYLAFSPYQPSNYSPYSPFGPSPYQSPPPYYTSYGSPCYNYYYSYSTYLWDVNNKEQIAAIDVGIPQFSPDEKLLVLKKCESALLSLWDLATGKQISAPIRGQSPIAGNVAFDPPTAKPQNDMAFSPATNNTFAIFNTDGSVSLWNTPALPSIPGAEVTLEHFPGSITNLALTADGGMLAASTRDEIKLFKKKTDHSYVSSSVLKNKHIKEMSVVYLSPDGTIVVAANNDGTLSLWNRAKDLQSSIPEAFYALSPDGKLLISSPGGRMFKLWDTETGKQIGNPVFGDILQFSPDGKYIVLSNGNNLAILESSSGIQIGDPIAGYYSWGFGPDSKTLIASNNGYNISLLHIGENPSRAITISLNNSPKFSADLHFVEATNSDGSFKIWDTLTGQQVGSIEGFFGEFRGFSPDNKLAYLYSYEKNGFILLDVPKQRISRAEMKKIIDDATIIPGSTLTFSDDGKFVVAAQVDWYQQPTATWLWDIDQRRQIASLSGSFKGFGIDDKFLITRTDKNDSIVEFLNPTDPTKKMRETFKYPGSLNNVTISRDGNTLAAFGNEGIRLLDLTRLDNKPVTLKEDMGYIQQMSFGPDGSTLATLGSDGLFLWNVADQVQVGSVIPEKSGRISTYRFSSDGSFITYVDQNGKVFTVGLEDVEASSDEKQAKATEKLSDVDVCSGVLSPSGRFVVSPSSRNKKLQIWDVNVADKSFADLDLVGNCYGSMAFSPDEGSFAYSDSDRIWVFTSDKAGKPFTRKVSLVGKPEDGLPYGNLTFVAGQKLLLTRTSNGRILVWDIAKRTQLAATDLSAEPIVFADDKLLTYLRTENKFVLTDFDQDAWKKTLNDWKGILCQKVRPKLSLSEWVEYFSGEYADYKGTCAP